MFAWSRGRTSSQPRPVWDAADKTLAEKNDALGNFVTFAAVVVQNVAAENVVPVHDPDEAAL